MRRRSLIALAVSVGVLLILVPAAYADEPFTGTGGPSTGGPGPTLEELALHAQKQKLATDYSLVKANKLDPAAFLAEYEAWAGTGAGALGVTPRGPEDPCPTCLNVTQYNQVETYYCGPATARAILGYLGVTQGPGGESLTQRHTANKCQTGYLCTDYLGETPWYYYSGYKRPMKSTLNQWADTSWYVVHSNSQDYQESLVFDIGHDYPIAMLVREEPNPNLPHLVGHPTNIRIGHWIAVLGYDLNGSWSYYADSVHGTSFWSWSDDVPAYSWILSGTYQGNTGLSFMMDYVPFGYVW